MKRKIVHGPCKRSDEKNVELLTRREVFRRVIVASALVSTFDLLSCTTKAVRQVASDPTHKNPQVSWPRLLSTGETATTGALADLILPADKLGPSAVAVGVAEFIDEWISAPVPRHQVDYQLVKWGLARLNEETNLDYKASFAVCTLKDQQATLDRLLSRESTSSQTHKFYKKFRELTAVGYFTTPDGWAALGYVGNVAMNEYPGVPPEILKRLGL